MSVRLHADSRGAITPRTRPVHRKSKTMLYITDTTGKKYSNIVNDNVANNVKVCTLTLQKSK